MTDLRLNRISIENNQLVIQKGNVLITSTQSNSLVSYGGIIFSNTSNSSSITQGGAVTILGGTSIKKDVYIGQSFLMNSSDYPFTVSGLINNRLFIGPTTTPEFYITPNGIDKRLLLNDSNLSINFTQSSTNSSSGAFVINGGGMSINTTTNSIDYTNGGAITIAGGMSVAKDTFINGNLNVNGQANFGNILNIDTSKLYSTNGNLELNSVNSIAFNCSIGSIKTNILNKNILDISLLNTVLNNTLFITNTNASINSSTGSIISSGGISILNTTNSLNIAQGGALTIAGGMSVAKDTWLTKLNATDIHLDINTNFSTSNGNLLINSGGDFNYNTTDAFKIRRDGSLQLKGYTLYSTSNSLSITNNTLINSNFNLVNSSTDNSRDTSFNIYGNINPLNIGWNNNKYGINCTNNSLYIQGNQLVLNTNGNTIVNSNLFANGSFIVNNTTNSFSNSSGSVVINGGIGIQNDLYMGNKLTLNSDIQLSNFNSGVFEISSSSSPQIKLFKSNDSSNYPFSLNLYSLTSGSNSEYLSIYNTNNSYHIDSKISGSGLYRNIFISTNTSSITLSTSGNIGINNVNPLFSLDVIGNSNINGNLTLNTINISDTSNNSLVTLGGITIGKDASCQNLNVSTNTILNNTTMGNINMSSGIVSGNFTVNNNTIINQNLSIGSTLNCNGIVSLNNTSNNALSILGGTYIGKNLSVNGNTIVSGLFNTSNITFPRFSINETNGNFIITNTTTGNNSIVINLNGGMSLNEPINANGNVIFNNTFNAKGTSIFDQDINANGRLYINNTSVSINSSTGSLIVLGGIGLNGNLNMNGDFNLIGNLTVSGTVSNINSTNININDNIILLNSGINGSRDSGILINRYQNDNDNNLGDVINDLQYISFTLPSQTGLPLNIITLPSSASSLNNTYNNYWIKVISGFSNSQIRKITSYDGTTKKATLSSNFTSQNPNSGDVIHLYYKSFVGLIYDETNDNFALGSSVVNPSSAPVQFTSYSSLKLQDLTLNGNISLNNTVNSTDNSSGSFIINGGGSIQKDLYIGGQLIVNNVNITPNSSDIYTPVIYNAFNNTLNGNIPGLSFGFGTFGVDISLYATLASSNNLYGYYKITLINKSSSWDIATSSIGDDLLLNFLVDNSGAVTYNTPNYSGFSSLVFRYKVITV